MNIKEEELKFLIPKPHILDEKSLKTIFKDEKWVQNAKYNIKYDHDNYKDEKKIKVKPDVKPEFKPRIKQEVSTIQKAIIPANYDALEVHGFYGLIHMGKGSYNEDNVIAHTSRRTDNQYMLSIQPGDYIPVVFLRAKRKGYVLVRYITRSKYFPPGSPITSISLGVENWDGTET